MLVASLWGAVRLLAPPAAAGEDPTSTTAPPGAEQVDPGGPPPPPIDVIEVRGLVDAIEAEFITRSIRAAEAGGSQLLVLQVDSPGAVVSSERLDELAFLVAHAEVPVTVWVGPSGAEARGGTVRLLQAAGFTGSATKARIGDFSGPCDTCPDPADAPLLSGRTFDPDEAFTAGAIDVVSPTLGDFIVDLDGREVGGETLRTARVVQRDTPRREPIAEVRFAKLGLVERVLHSTTMPWVAYVLYVLGLLLIVFEFYSVGIGLAGLTGAGSLVLGSYGLAALGAEWPGLALLALAAFGFGVDVQTGAPRAWSVIATASFVAGSWWLYPADLRLAIWVQVAGLIGALLFMLRAMPSVVRARFATATIGREHLIGAEAEATSDFDPEGLVRLRGGDWRARATRASRITTGSHVRVVAIDGLVLEVEPLDEPAPDAIEPPQAGPGEASLGEADGASRRPGAGEGG